MACINKPKLNRQKAKDRIEGFPPHQMVPIYVWLIPKKIMAVYIAVLSEKKFFKENINANKVNG